jgi:hypothetical protein
MLNLTYYVDAITQLICRIADPSALRLLYFYEAEDVETVSDWVAQLAQQFPEQEYIPKCSGERSDWEDLLLMSCCDHHVIANSTYSYWGAFLNPSANKVICCPDRWLGDRAVADDVYPPEWIRIIEK